MKVCPECGCAEFYTTGIEYYDWVVDGDGSHIETKNFYHSELGENEWYCRECGAEFAGPHELKEV